MADGPSVVTVLSVIASHLNEVKVQYAVVGGIAVLVYGYPRATQDIDLIVDQEGLNASAFCEYLRQHQFLADESDLQSAFREQSHATIFHQKLSLRLDVKGVYSSLDRDTVSTAVPMRLGGVTFCINTPENLICHKLQYGSARDLEDALAVYTRMKPRLRSSELRRVARLVGVEEALDELTSIADRSLREQQDWARRHEQKS
jgi:hypothetical protein